MTDILILNFNTAPQNVADVTKVYTCNNFDRCHTMKMYRSYQRATTSQLGNTVIQIH